MRPSHVLRRSKNAKKRKKSKFAVHSGLRGIGNDGPAPPVRGPEPHSDHEKSRYQGPVFDVFRASNGGRVHTADIRHLSPPPTPGAGSGSNIRGAGGADSCCSVSAGAGMATVTAAVPLAEPDVAVIVAVPSATEVTEPVEETVATDEADDDHETLAPLIVAPF